MEESKNQPALFAHTGDTAMTQAEFDELNSDIDLENLSKGADLDHFPDDLLNELTEDDLSAVQRRYEETGCLDEILPEADLCVATAVNNIQKYETILANIREGLVEILPLLTKRINQNLESWHEYEPGDHITDAFTDEGWERHANQYEYEGATQEEYDELKTWLERKIAEYEQAKLQTQELIQEGIPETFAQNLTGVLEVFSDEE